MNTSITIHLDANRFIDNRELDSYIYIHKTVGIWYFTFAHVCTHTNIISAYLSERSANRSIILNLPFHIIEILNWLPTEKSDTMDNRKKLWDAKFEWLYIYYIHKHFLYLDLRPSSLKIFVGRMDAVLSTSLRNIVKSYILGCCIDYLRRRITRHHRYLPDFSTVIIRLFHITTWRFFMFIKTMRQYNKLCDLFIFLILYVTKNQKQMSL